MYASAGGRSRPPAVRHREPARDARRPAAAALLCHSASLAERVRAPAATRNTRRSRPRKASCAGSRRPTSSKACSAHELAHVKHRDILISSVAATLAAAIMMISRFAMFFGGSARRQSPGREPDRAHRDDHRWRRLPRCSFRRRSRDRVSSTQTPGAPRLPAVPTASSAAAQEDRGRRRTRSRSDANPATAHMFIIKPFSAAGLFGLCSARTRRPTNAFEALLPAEPALKRDELWP